MVYTGLSYRGDAVFFRIKSDSLERSDERASRFQRQPQSLHLIPEKDQREGEGGGAADPAKDAKIDALFAPKGNACLH